MVHYFPKIYIYCSGIGIICKSEAAGEFNNYSRLKLFEILKENSRKSLLKIYNEKS